MRLSEAIREGSKGNGQCFEGYSNGADYCAFGAAVKALHGTIRLNHIIATEGLPASLLLARCPEECFGESPCLLLLSEVIVHLNDDHRWTREAIADWVQAQEALAGIGQDSEVAPAETPAPELVTA